MICNIAVIEEVLKHGKADVAYARVMFLGPAGAGKSSLLKGLKNEDCSDSTSTLLADISDIKYQPEDEPWKDNTEDDKTKEMANYVDIRYQWIEPGNVAGGAWKDGTEDKAKELASLSHQVVQENKAERSEDYTAGGDIALAEQPPSSSSMAAKTNEGFAEEADEIYNNITQDVSKELQQNSSSSKSAEVILHVWDCGGQPVFLNILSAFLTERTMFLLIFNASQCLDTKYKPFWKKNGETYEGEEQNITVLNLMMQWMQLIHGSLLVTHGEATEGYIPYCPKVMIVGTHGDKVRSKQGVLDKLKSSCEESVFYDILYEPRHIVDNTTAGRGSEEDPAYGEIRNAIYDFARNLSTPTHLAWVSFRKVVQEMSAKNPVLTYEQVLVIASKCEIPQKEVPAVLDFYHQLGVFLYYDKIPLLSKTIFSRPQWLIDQLCQPFLPALNGFRPEAGDKLWTCLDKYGVLLEPLYKKLWEKCPLEEGAQAMADLLEYFFLAKVIKSVPKKFEFYKNCEYNYFVPCTLNTRTSAMKQMPETLPGEKVIRRAATLHIGFSTKYSPPGFFVRLAVQMAEMFTPDYERGVYCDSISFCNKEKDIIFTISEFKSLSSIQVDVIRVERRDQNRSRFAEFCYNFLRNELFSKCTKILDWFSSIEFHFAFRCCVCNAYHRIAPHMHRMSSVFCSQSRMEPEHKYWLPLPPLNKQVHTCTCLRRI